MTGNLGHIEDIVVAEELRGTGFGKKIMIALNRIGLEAEGCRRVGLFCKDHNIKFYEGLGYKTEGIEMFHRKENNWL